MIPDLENLVKLQEIDLKIKEQEDAKEQYPVAVKDFLGQIAQAEDDKSVIAAKLERLSADTEKLNSQIVKLRENLSKSEEKLNTIKTNREYDAVHAEIETQKEMLSTAENKREVLETETVNNRVALEETETECERIKSELQPQIDDLNAKIEAIDSNIAEIVKEKDVVSPNINPYTMRTYDSIRTKSKSGKAVAVVRDSKTCTTCFMVLRPQLFSEIRKGDRFIICENCGSMLVWGGTVPGLVPA
ncbi:MAG: C4-type zinc ribbon domain-containing protein [Chitinispirillales bacterium]|jgi:predicted  nucleic acid-binding Zn-ribbon protein|nr:C4-type zinc ribbon domain-containing protein [Chitinispirillales bacterium]